MQITIPTNYHPSWENFFNQPFVQNEIERINQELEQSAGSNGVQFTPNPALVLRFALQDLHAVKAVWIGRDPYPQPNIATGRCFEVNGANDWFSPEINISLKNIVKLLHKSHFNHKTAKPIQAVREDIQSGAFPILPPNEAFAHWASEGVLFLNSAFTCGIGGFEQAGSHEKLWKPFFKHLLSYIANSNDEIAYFLWGKARDYGKLLIRQGVGEDWLYPSKHPCTNGDKGEQDGYLNGYKRNTDFLNNPCFYETKAQIKWV